MSSLKYGGGGGGGGMEDLVLKLYEGGITHVKIWSPEIS